eukprot:m.1637941 g.1637941  ORF g.1637941 m.1637941 type:complete len:267 (+) comp26445_c0_seq1:386-1186(+)
MPHAREEQQNSSCALFLAIIFVLMLFGNSHDERDANSRYYGRYYMSTTTTPAPWLMDGNVSIYTPHRYDNAEIQKHNMERNRESARIVVLLFGSLMLVQMLGFCFVIMLRRRALRQHAMQEFTGSAVTRSDVGWDGFDSSEDDLEEHPTMMSLRNNDTDCNGAGEVLPTYEETIAPPPTAMCSVDTLPDTGGVDNGGDDLDGLPSYALATTSEATVEAHKSDGSDDDADGDSIPCNAIEMSPPNVVAITDDCDDDDNDDDSTPLLI